MKKLISLVLALAMVLMVGAALADPAGSLKILSSEASTEYDFYRVLDLELTAISEGVNGYDYSLNSKWHDFWTNGAGASYLVTTNSGNLNAVSVDGTLKYINLSESNIVAFTNAAMAYADSAKIAYDVSATGTGSDLTVSVDTLGYYLMIPVDASIKTAVSSGSVASITSTNPNSDIKVKAVKPEVEKTDDAQTAEIGQTIRYTVTGTVPNTAGYNTYKYILADTMTSGLTLKHDVVVTVATREGNVDATVTYSANGFQADIPVMTLQEYVGKTITVTYTAVVNEDAIQHVNEKNEVKILYGHDPDHLEESTPKKEELYTAKVIINKYTGDSAETGPKLSDAEFALINAEGKAYVYHPAVTGDTPADAYVEWVTVTGGPSANETTAVSDSMIAALTTAGATTKTTNSDGAAEFIGLADGTYYLVEMAAPSGYNRLQFAKAVTVQGVNVDTPELENKAQTSQDAYDEARNAIADVQNQSGTQLPTTGGIGTTIFYIVGGILLVGAAIILVSRRKAHE